MSMERRLNVSIDTWEVARSWYSEKEQKIIDLLLEELNYIKNGEEGGIN